MPQIFAKTNQILPASVTDGTQIQARAGKYGELIVVPLTAGTYALAVEGQYFKACGPIATAIAIGGATQTAWVATTPSFHVRNGAGANGVSLFLDYMRITIIGAGATITGVHGAVVLDAASRYTSGGQLLTSVNPNLSMANVSVAASPVFGAITATAATSPKVVSRFALKSSTPVAGETWVINFGAVDSVTSTGNAASVGPVILGPNANHTALVYLWFTGATAAPTAEIELGWWER